MRTESISVTRIDIDLKNLQAKKCSTRYPGSCIVCRSLSTAPYENRRAPQERKTADTVIELAKNHKNLSRTFAFYVYLGTSSRQNQIFNEIISKQ